MNENYLINKYNIDLTPRFICQGGATGPTGPTGPSGGPTGPTGPTDTYKSVSEYF